MGRGKMVGLNVSRYRSLACVASLAGLSLLAVSCSSASSGTGATSNSAVQTGSDFTLPANLKGAGPATVKIAFKGGYQASQTPIDVAFGAGYFNAVDKRFHTTISADLYNGSQGEAALLGGTDQFYETNLADALTATLADKDQVAILNEQVSLSIPLIGPTKYETTRGANIDAYDSPTWCEETGPGGAADTAIRLMAAVHHLDISKYNLVNLNGSTSVLPTLAAGRCDLVAADPTSGSEGIVTKQAYLVANTMPASTAVQLAGAQAGAPLTTTHAFINKYPELTQAIIDAVIRGLIFTQAHADDPSAIYATLPVAMKQTVTEATFDETMRLYGDAYSSKYNDGTFTAGMIADTFALDVALKIIPSASALAPDAAIENKFVIQAYKDLDQPRPTGPQNGPAKVPSAAGLPSLEAATAVATLTGGPVARNSGKSPLAG
jgi:hypothetical protein